MKEKEKHSGLIANLQNMYRDFIIRKTAQINEDENNTLNIRQHQTGEGDKPGPKKTSRPK